MNISNKTKKKLSLRSTRRLKKLLSSRKFPETSYIYASVQFMILSKKLNIRIIDTNLTFDDANENLKNN